MHLCFRPQQWRLASSHPLNSWLAGSASVDIDASKMLTMHEASPPDPPSFKVPVAHPALLPLPHDCSRYLPDMTRLLLRPQPVPKNYRSAKKRTTLMTVYTVSTTAPSIMIIGTEYKWSFVSQRGQLRPASRDPVSHTAKDQTTS